MFKFSHIATKYLFWVLIASLLPLCFLGYLSYTTFATALKDEVTENLIILAESKSHRIERYFSERRNNVTTLARNPTIIDALSRYDFVYKEKGVGSHEYQALNLEYRPYLTSYKEEFGFYDLFLISTNGDIVFTVSQEQDLKTNLKDGPYKTTQLAKVFAGAYTLMETGISDFDYYSPSGRPAAFIAAPVFKQKELVGIIAFQLELNVLFDLVQDYTGLGKTGETAIATKVEKEAVIVAPLRSDPHAAFKRKIQMGSDNALPIQHAVLGKRTNGIYVDYRGRKVLAVSRYLPHSRWGMVVKMDVKEAFAPVTRLRNRILLIGFCAALLAIFTSTLVSRSVTHPIKTLSDETKIIGSGNLEHKAATQAKDEIGQLSRTFDQVIEHLKNTMASRDAFEMEIIERKRVEEELARSNLELEQFAYVASHDLKEPLRMVTSYVQLLERRCKDQLDPEAMEFIEFASDGAKRMHAMITDLLEFSRVGTKGKEFEPVDTEKIFDQAVKNLKVLIEESGAKIIRDSLPLIEADPNQYMQLFQNLLHNAIKFSGGHTPIVRVTAKQCQGEWTFSFQDNGIGIDPQYKEQIFVIFQRLHNREEYGGTGIGLAIVKKIVERHGGRIWVESEKGKGAAFRFTTPIRMKEEKN